MKARVKAPVPLIPRLEYVATPAEKVTVDVPMMLPVPVAIVAAKVGAVVGVTVLLFGSTIRITGWVENATLLVVPFGAVVICRVVGTTENVELMPVKSAGVNESVDEAAEPWIPNVENVAVPAEAVAVAVPISAPPPLTIAAVTTAVEAVNRPFASTIRTTG